MKKLSLNQQRSLYQAYKETRLRQAYDTMALMKTGTYHSESSKNIMEKAKADILNFVSVFEQKLVIEVQHELAEN